MPYVALLRGINLGEKNKIPMKTLVAMFEEAACTHVQHFIQSGNVVFEAPAKLARQLPDSISARIREHFDYEVPVILRSAAELSAAIQNNPFLAGGADPNTLHLMCLTEVPDAKLVATLDPDRGFPDKFAVHGRDIYLWVPNGLGRSKLTNAWFDGKLKTVSTVRNWRTVLKLRELMLS